MSINPEILWIARTFYEAYRKEIDHILPAWDALPNGDRLAYIGAAARLVAAEQGKRVVQRVHMPKTVLE